MKLSKLLAVITEDTTVWISTSIVNSDCIVFSEVKYIDEQILDEIKDYEVRDVYPEHYPARYCHGITIIVNAE